MSFRYVATGFRQDMEELFSRFLTMDETFTEKTTTKESPKEMSLRFTRFSQIWRQMNFSLVFRHRLNENDLREFIEEIYLVVLPNVCSEYSFERRVCAIYLLYCLFVKQPQSLSVKIRINFSYFEEIRQLIQKCKQLEQLDVCFVWYKLWSLGAIDLVYVCRPVGPYFIRNSRVTIGNETKTDFLLNQFKTAINMPFNELSQIHEKYQTLKEELCEDNPLILEGCDAAEENVFESNKLMASLGLLKNDKHLDKWMSTIGSEKSCVIKEKPVSDMGAKRRQLKDRALNCKTNISNGMTLQRRYGPITALDIGDENQKKPKGKRGRPRVAKLNAIL